MLHYRILSYGSDYDWGLLVDLISLRDRNEIERQFVRRLNENETGEPYADALSAALMKELDNSVRVGEYAVLTPRGKGCITCLSDDIRFGLLVIDMGMQGKAVITKPGAVSMKLLDWLSRHGEYTLVLTDNECDYSMREVLTLVSNGAADIEYGGEVFSAYSMNECLAALAPLFERNSGREKY
ncbi:hypothetical protein [uncultured Ruminococcus sp.]|uniref:hypothetical protein n=1 Tax=uncultured Ruminococcus sp. TaxID=165186 RepID=UPI0025D5AAE1|nr:hypothetical protein [uncultured Ruminococcus sp.]